MFFLYNRREELDERGKTKLFSFALFPVITLVNKTKKMRATKKVALFFLHWMSEKSPDLYFGRVFHEGCQKTAL